MKDLNKTPILIVSILAALCLVLLYLFYTKELPKSTAVDNVSIIPSLENASLSKPVSSETPTMDYSYESKVFMTLPSQMSLPVWVNTGQYAKETLLPNTSVLQLYFSGQGYPVTQTYREFLNTLTTNKFTLAPTSIAGKEGTTFYFDDTGSIGIWGGNTYSKMRGVAFNYNDTSFFVIIHYANRSLEAFDKDIAVFDAIVTSLRFID